MTGCQTTGPVKYHQVEKGSWQTRILVRDKKKAQSFIVNVDLKAEASGKLRMDATSSFGQHLASLVINGKSVTYIVVPQKKYFKGKVSRTTLKRAIGVNINPNLLFPMIFEQPPASSDWICTKDKKGYLNKCLHEKDGIEMTWKNRDAGRKLVTFDHERAKIQMNFAGFDPEFLPTAKTYRLKIPRSFRRIR